MLLRSTTNTIARARQTSAPFFRNAAPAYSSQPGRAKASKGDAMTSRVLNRQDFTPMGFKWLGLKRIQWEGPDGRPRIYEAAERTSRRGPVDGVAIIAKVRQQGHPLRLVLEAQFRPPLGNMVIELPAGLIDGGEDAETAALRELREETGYSGGVALMSPVCYSDPGMSNANMQFVEVDVDADAEANAKVEPHQEDGEFIDVFLLPFEGLYDALVVMQKETGWDVDARLLMYAAGLKLGSTMSSPSSTNQPLTAAAPDPAAPPRAEVARWRQSDEVEALSPVASGLSLQHSVSKQSLASAAGLGGEVAGSGESGHVSTSATSVLVTPEELRLHGIDRVRIVPQGTLKRRLVDRITLTSAGLGLLFGIGISHLVGLGLAMGLSWGNPRTRVTWR